jgi:multidrug resistance efflux pump
MLGLRRQRQHDHGLDGEEQQQQHQQQQQQQQDEEEAEEEERQSNLQNALHQFIPAHLSLPHLVRMHTCMHACISRMRSACVSAP